VLSWVAQGLLTKLNTNLRPGNLKRQGGGAATQLPAEQYHSGSNPDLGFTSPSISYRPFVIWIKPKAMAHFYSDYPQSSLFTLGLLQHPKYVSTM
jgi:hypothetical protein